MHNNKIYKMFHALSTHLKSPKLKLNMLRPSGPHQLTPYCYAQMECAVEQLSDKVTSKEAKRHSTATCGT